MKTKKGLIILGIAFLFLVTFSTQCSAQTEDSDMGITLSVYVLVFGVILLIVALFLMFVIKMFDLGIKLLMVSAFIILMYTLINFS